MCRNVAENQVVIFRNNGYFPHNIKYYPPHGLVQVFSVGYDIFVTL